MILSEKEIREYINTGKLIIDPLKGDTIRENGLDLRLGNRIARLRNANDILDIKSTEIKNYYIFEEGDSFVINPMEKVLIHTLEYIKMPGDVIGLINLRSSYARLGITIPPTVVDAKFEGQLTIGLMGSSFPIRLYPGERIIHLILVKLSSLTRPYKGKYLRQRGIKLPIFND